MICAATRIHVGDMSKPPDMSKLGAFAAGIAPAVSRIAIAVGVPGVPESEAAARLAGMVEAAQREAAGAGVPVDVVPVQPWGKFVPALNMLAAHAARSGCDYVLFASVEAVPSASTVEALARQVVNDDSALVAGAALQGHDFSQGEREISGVTVPWNTLALWRLATLNLVGFVLVADGLFDGVDGGVEEAATIECIHRIAPGRATAYLVQLDDVTWETSFDDPKRQESVLRRHLSEPFRAGGTSAKWLPRYDASRWRASQRGSHRRREQKSTSRLYSAASCVTFLAQTTRPSRPSAFRRARDGPARRPCRPYVVFAGRRRGRGAASARSTRAIAVALVELLNFLTLKCGKL